MHVPLAQQCLGTFAPYGTQRLSPGMAAFRADCHLKDLHSSISVQLSQSIHHQNPEPELEADSLPPKYPAPSTATSIELSLLVHLSPQDSPAPVRASSDRLLEHLHYISYNVKSLWLMLSELNGRPPFYYTPRIQNIRSVKWR